MLARIRWEDPEVHRAEVPLDEVVHHQPQQVQPPQALVHLPRVYGYESRKTAPIKSMPSGFPEFRADGRGPPGDAGSAVLSPESGAAQWRLPSGAVRLLKWDLRHGER